MLNFEKVEIKISECSEFPLDLYIKEVDNRTSYVWNNSTKEWEKQNLTKDDTVFITHSYMSPDDCIKCYLDAKKLLKQFKKPKPHQLVNPILIYFDYEENGFGMLGLERK